MKKIVTTRENGTRREQLFTVGKSRTKQSEAKACDINNIMKKYVSFDRIPEELKRKVQYGDFTTVSDYQEALQIIKNAQETFNVLNSQLRNKFKNDPLNLIAYVNDPNNDEEAYELGIKVRTEKPKAEEGKKATEPKGEGGSAPVPGEGGK